MTEREEPPEIERGMAAFGLEGHQIGEVEMVDGDDLRIAGRAVQMTDVVGTDRRGVHLRLPESDFESSTTGADTTAGRTSSDRASAATDEMVTPSTENIVATGGEQTVRDFDERDGRMVIALAEERLSVDTRDISLGEVIIRKRVIEEEQMVPMTVRREVVEVLRLKPGEAMPDDWQNDPTSEVARLPLSGTEQQIGKEAIVTREAIIERDARTEERQITDTVRRERVEMDDGYARARPDFERHFAGQGDGGSKAKGDFATAEPHYRAGYTAGRDPRYAEHDFAAAEPDLRREHESAAQSGGDSWEELRERIRVGYEAARR